MGQAGRNETSGIERDVTRRSGWLVPVGQKRWEDSFHRVKMAGNMRENGGDNEVKQGSSRRDTGSFPEKGILISMNLL